MEQPRRNCVFATLAAKRALALDGSFFETNLLTQPLSVPYLFFRSDVGPDPDPGNLGLTVVPMIVWRFTMTW